MTVRGNRRVFRGRLLGDGMWVVHLVFSLWILAGLGLGSWGWVYALNPGIPPATRTMLTIAALAIVLVIDIPFIIVWKDVARPVILRPDGLQMGKTLIPYEDMAFLGLSRGERGDLVLISEPDAGSGRFRREISLPRWAASHDGFLLELVGRAPRVVFLREGLRPRAVTAFANTVFFLWCTLAAALLSAAYIPPLRTRLPWLTPRNLAGILAGGFAVCFVYVIIAAGQTSGRRDARRG
jgi:hypothetical protein